MFLGKRGYFFCLLDNIWKCFGLNYAKTAYAYVRDATPQYPRSKTASILGRYAFLIFFDNFLNFCFGFIGKIGDVSDRNTCGVHFQNAFHFFRISFGAFLC
jgi:hypothetical protein